MRSIGVEGRPATRTQWMQLGLLTGLLALSNPSTLLFLAACGVWILSYPKSRSLSGAALAVAICLLTVAPWTVRNARVFHHFIPMRANAGAEFYLGNGPGATGLVMEYDHPFADTRAVEQYRQLGEYAYAQQQGRAAWSEVRAHPARFAALVARRVYFYWCGVPHEAEPRWDKALADWLRVVLFTFTSAAGLLGLALALRRKIAAAPMFAAAFALVPVTYYFFFAHARFRHPLEPLIAVLGVWLFQSCTKSAGLQS
jgi:hypothetical protein